MSRDVEIVVPALLIPVFMFAVTVGALQDFAENIPGLDYRAFQLPVAVMFAVTGISRAITVVTDIQTGYFARLVITSVNRLALLLGLLVADSALIVALTAPVVIMGYIVGVRFETGIPGILSFMLIAGLWGLIFNGFPYAIAFKTGNVAAVNMSFMLIAGLWGLIFNGFPYAIAFKTGNVAAVNMSFMLFFPFLFMTTLFIPQEQMSPWLSTVADYNPVTYILAAERSLISEGEGSATATLGGVLNPPTEVLGATRGRYSASLRHTVWPWFNMP